MQSKTRVRTARVGSDEGVVDIQIWGVDLIKHERRVAQASGVRESAKGDEFADGVVMKVETLGDEDGVDGFQLAHVSAALCQRHAPLPYSEAAVHLRA